MFCWFILLPHRNKLFFERLIDKRLLYVKKSRDLQHENKTTYYVEIQSWKMGFGFASLTLLYKKEGLLFEFRKKPAAAPILAKW